MIFFLYSTYVRDSSSSYSSSSSSSSLSCPYVSSSSSLLHSPSPPVSIRSPPNLPVVAYVLAVS